MISDDHFEINSGSYINSPGGSDSFSGPTFGVEARFRSNMNIYDLSWTDIFQEAARSWALDIYDDSHEELLDWEERDISMFWEWIDGQQDDPDTQFDDWMSDHVPGWKGL